jgi:3-hydroxyacyl-CoA dehydrogenase
LLPQAAEDVVAIDAAMKLGYNWKYGPFELIDRIGGADFVARLEADGKAVPVPADCGGASVLSDRSGQAAVPGPRRGLPRSAPS